MGTWGTGLYSDDTACDVRDSYRAALGDGLEGPQATARVLEEWAALLEDPDTGPVLWLALADSQWRCGRLEEAVKQRALAIIDDGSDLARWQESPADEKKRRAVLEGLRGRLELAQRSPTRVRKRYRAPERFAAGEMFAYRLAASGRWVAFTVVGNHQDRGGVYPEVALHRIEGDAPPQWWRAKLSGLRESAAADLCTQLLLAEGGKDAFPEQRIVRLGRRPTRLRSGDATVVHWQRLDQVLAEAFGVR